MPSPHVTYPRSRVETARTAARCTSKSHTSFPTELRCNLTRDSVHGTTVCRRRNWNVRPSSLQRSPVTRKDHPTGFDIVNWRNVNSTERCSREFRLRFAFATIGWLDCFFRVYREHRGAKLRLRSFPPAVTMPHVSLASFLITRRVFPRERPSLPPYRHANKERPSVIFFPARHPFLAIS